MGSEKKEMFRRRTAAQIRKLDTQRVWSGDGLTSRLLAIDPVHEALELRVQVTPGRYFQGDVSGRRASRLYWKHGGVLRLDLPESIAESDETPRTVRSFLEQSVDEKFENLSEREVNHIGYGWTPLQTPNRTRQVVPSIWKPEGERMFALMRGAVGGERIEIVRIDGDAKSVALDGAVARVYVPSRSRGHPGYVVTLAHVPVSKRSSTRATPLSIVSSMRQEYNRPPVHLSFNVRFPFANSPERQDVHVFYPHAIAAYNAVAEHYARRGNRVPLENSPFPFSSREHVEVYMRLLNNVVIYDSSLASKENLRTLHIDEISALLMRGMHVLGPDRALRNPRRDGPIAQYRWVL